MGIKTPTGNWTRTPRLTADDLHANAVARKDRFTKWFMGADGKPHFTVEYPKPPHAPRGTMPRLHRRRNLIEKIRMMLGSGPVSRLSLVP
jgi:hypothetical protein